MLTPLEWREIENRTYIPSLRFRWLIRKEGPQVLQQAWLPEGSIYLNNPEAKWIDVLTETESK